MNVNPAGGPAAIARFLHLPSFALSLVGLIAGLVASASAYQETAPVAPYSVAASPWAINQRGSHRAA